MPVFPEREGSFVLLFALMVIYNTRSCVGLVCQFENEVSAYRRMFSLCFDDI